MNTEFDALLKNGTWSLVPSSPNINIVGSKWVFRIKRKANGQIERYKARLVAKGFHQQLGIDFAETYSPMVKPITSGCQQRLSTWTSSRSSLYGSTSWFFYHPNHPTTVCKLHKAVYGLKQAPRAWFSRLST
jgi:hypothetical protein